MASDPLIVVRLLASAFQRLDIPYLIGGSIASSAFGEFRATQDVDFAVDMVDTHAEPLVRTLGLEFYSDESAILDAVKRRSSFNVIHLPTMYKADVFVLPDDDVYRNEMARRQLTALPFGDEMVSVYVASPEDIVLHKLRWYRLGEEVSERQWRDVLGVLKVQAGGLDEEYMRTEANKLGVADLLNKALVEAA